MDFWDVLVRRRSVRQFESEDVPQSAVEEIIKAASLAPRGSNVKNWHFIIVRDRGIKQKMLTAVKKKIDELAGRMKSKRAREDFLTYSRYFTFFSDAPVVIAVVMKKYDSLSVRILARYDKDKEYSSTAGVQNVAAALQNIMLATTAMGLGCCWMTGPMIAKKGLEKVLGVKGEDNLIALVPVGIPKDIPSSRKFPESVDDIMTVL